MGKGYEFLEGRSGFIEIAIINLHHESYLTYYLQADGKIYHLLFFTYVFSLFRFIEIFLTVSV